MTCPNLSHPTYQGIKANHGDHAQYVASALFDLPAFQQWKGDDEIPSLDDNGNVLSNSGSTFSIVSYLRSFLDTVPQSEANTPYYELIGGKMEFRKNQLVEFDQITPSEISFIESTTQSIPLTLEEKKRKSQATLTELKDGATVDQQKTIDKLFIANSKITLEEETHTYSDGTIEYTPTTTAIGSTFQGDTGLYKNSAVWGTQSHKLLEDAIRGQEYRDTPNLSTAARQKLITYFENLVADLTKDGTKLISETILFDPTSKVAGSLDLILVHPDGSISIYDLKTSMNSTLSEKYDKKYNAPGISRSKRDQHSMQLGVYKALAEDLGLKVVDLKIIPTKLEVTGDKVQDIAVEPQIEIQSPEMIVMNLLANRRLNNESGTKTQKDYTKFLNKLKVLLQEKIDKIEKSLTQKSGASAVRLTELKGLQETLIGVDAVKEISKVIDSVHSELVSGKGTKKSYSAQFDQLITNVDVAVASKDTANIKDALNKLNIYFNYVQDYKGLEEYRSIYSDSVSSKVKAEPDSPLAKLNEIITVRDEMEAAYYKAVRPLMAEILSDEINEDANKAAMEFLDKKNELVRLRDLAYSEGKTENAAKFQKRIDYIESKFKELHTDKAKITSQLQTTSGDLGIFEFLTGTLSNTSDSILGLFAKKIKALFARVDETMFAFQREAAAQFQEFAKATGRNQNKPDEFNAGLYEVVNRYVRNEEGEYTAIQEKHFVSELDQNAYNLALHNMFKTAERIEKETNEKNKWNTDSSEDLGAQAKAKYIREWYRENHVPLPQDKIDEILLQKEIDLNQKHITRQEYDLWYAQNAPTFNGTTEYLRELTTPNLDKYGSQAYANIQANPAMKKYYDFLVSNYLESQRKYPLSDRMGYKLPSIGKALEDKIREDGGWKKILPNLQDTLLQTTKDAELYGFGNKVVPTYFTQYMEVDEVSNDLIGSITRFTQATTQYEAIAGNVESVGLQTEAIALLNILKNRDVEKTDSKSQTVIKDAAKKLGLTDAEVDKKGGYYAAFFEHFIDQNLFGKGEDKLLVSVPEFTIGNTKFGGGTVDTAKLTNTFMGLASWPALGGPFTVLKAIANKLNAEANVLIESLSNQYLTKKSLAKGKSVYNKWVVSSMMKDYNSPVPQSLEGQLMDWFSPIQGSFRDSVGQELSWNGFKKAFVPGSWFFLQAAGEHSAQMGMFFGVLNETKVPTADGNEVSLLNAYELDQQGNLKLKEGVIFSQEDKDKLTNRIHAINKSLHGIYNKMDKSVAQKQAIGRLAFMYRKFLVPAVKRRWGTVKVDQELGDTVEGYHRTILRTAYQDHKNLIAFYSGKSTNLTKMEQANIRRATVELVMVMTLSTMIAFLVGMKDDDESLRKGKGVTGYVFNAGLYQAMRLNSEFQFFLPGIGLGDQLRVFTSPSAANSTLKKLAQFGGQLTTGPFETYDQNSRWHKKGDSKLGASALSLLGFYSTDPLRALEQFSKLY
jgi:hypothetical protein